MAQSLPLSSPLSHTRQHRELSKASESCPSLPRCWPHMSLQSESAGSGAEGWALGPVSTVLVRSFGQMAWLLLPHMQKGTCKHGTRLLGQAKAARGFLCACLVHRLPWSVTGSVSPWKEAILLLVCNAACSCGQQDTGGVAHGGCFLSIRFLVLRAEFRAFTFFSSMGSH